MRARRWHLLVSLACAAACGRRDVDEEALEQPVVTPAIRKVAIVMLQLADDTSQPTTVAQARTLAFTGPYSARAFYLEWSFGNLSIEGDLNGACPASIPSPDAS